MFGVILANTGSPSAPNPDAIEGYLRQFLMDDRIRQMPKPIWKWLLNRHILPRRKFSSAERYRFIWSTEGSPLVVNQASLAQKVQQLFEADEATAGKFRVLSAMSYGNNSIGEALQTLREAGCDQVVLLPLYPQSAFSPTMAVVDAFYRAQDAIDWHPATFVIDNYHDHPAYIELIVSSIRSVGYNPAAGDRLLLSFHAIPLKDEAAGDTYRSQIKESVKRFAEGLGIKASDIVVAYQSVFGHDKSKWVSPLTLDVLQSWREESFRVVLACPGFSIDCLETLYDIPHEMVPALEGKGAVPTAAHVEGDIQAVCNTSGRFIWVPTPNNSKSHAAMVKAVIEREIGSE